MDKMKFLQTKELDIQNKVILCFYEEDIQNLPPEMDQNIYKVLMLKKSRKEMIVTLKQFFHKVGHKEKEGYQIDLTLLKLSKDQLAPVVEVIIKALLYGAYHFSPQGFKEIKGKPLYQVRDQLMEESPAVYTFVSDDDLSNSINTGEIFARAINHSRSLGNLPNNYLHPEELASYANDLANHCGMYCVIHGNDDLTDMGCGGILCVNQGSSRPALLITLCYEGKKGEDFTGLVGKGVMFDSGGYHLKSMSGMDGMKYDMCGAANILAVMEIAARLKLNQNIYAVLPAVENSIGPDSCKMNDVITTMSGKTVEVYNTDAEGRLILCDALTVAQKKPVKRVLDLATLTYSCQGALGDDISGIFANDDTLFDLFTIAAKETGEQIWRMPLNQGYHEKLKWSFTADLMNYTPGSGGGAGIAAAFLEEFIDPALPWIHADVVGPAVLRSEKEGQSKGATGVMADTIAQLL